MQSLNDYRTKVRSLEDQRNKNTEEYNKAQKAFSENENKLATELKTAHENLDLIIISEAEKKFNVPNREQAIFKGLFQRDKKAAIDWCKTKFYISKNVNYPSTVKRVKKVFGYSLKEGSDFKDELLTKSEAFKKAMRELYLTSVPKKPKGSADHYGVEIECFVPRNPDKSIRDEFQQYCIDNRIKGAQIKSDSSISPDVDRHEGIEITVLVPRDNIRDLEMVCKWLKEKKAKVNSSCGLHVHLDFRNKTNIEQAGNRLYNALPYLSRIVPETRRNNKYCKLDKNTVSGGDDRYCAINMAAYSKYKTLEVRLHSGSCNFGKITSWLMIVSNIVDNEKFSTAQSDTSVDRFIELLDFKSDDLNYYIYERYRKFNGEKAVREERGEE